MFHISTPFDYSHSSPFSRYPSSSLSSANAYLPPSYASYDEERSRIEQALLARKQQERRQAEAAAFAAEQRRIERQAAIAEAIREERERREYERALRYREEMVRKAREEEEAKERYIRAMRVQQELSRRQQLEEQQEQGRRNERATEQRQINQDKIPDLFQLLFGGRLPETTRRTEPAPAAQPSTPSPLQTQPSRSEQPQLDLPHFLGAIFGTPQTSTTTQAPPTSQQAPASISQLSPSPVAQTSSSPSSAPDLSTPAPASTPIVEPQPPVDSPSSDEEEEAATKLQRHFRRHLARRNALDKISSLSSSFLDRQSTFEKPTSLTFQSSLDATSSTTTPSLAFVSSNSPFLAYEDYLVNLLSKIDAVESGGDKQVKSERKSLVRKVEMELSRLDAMKERAWEEQVKAVKAESMLEDKKVDASTAEPVQDSPSSSDSSASLTSDTTEYEDTSLPSLLPLTHDAVSSLPTSSPPSLSRSPSDSGSSTTSSTLTVSSASSQIDQYISEMLRRAQKLGEQVEKMELEEESKPREVVIA